jgi:hypothetical protein
VREHQRRDEGEAARQYLYVAGALYGVLIYVVMYWLVVPIGFGSDPSTTL